LVSIETISREFFGGSKKKKSKSTIQEDPVVEVPSDVKHLQPGTEGTLVGTEKSGRKRKKELAAEKLDKDELPMEERLANLTMDAPAAGASAIRGNNLAHLLSQVNIKRVESLCHRHYLITLLNRAIHLSYICTGSS